MKIFIAKNLPTIVIAIILAVITGMLTYSYTINKKDSEIREIKIAKENLEKQITDTQPTVHLDTTKKPVTKTSTTPPKQQEIELTDKKSESEKTTHIVSQDDQEKSPKITTDTPLSFHQEGNTIFDQDKNIITKVQPKTRIVDEFATSTRQGITSVTSLSSDTLSQDPAIYNTKLIYRSPEITAKTGEGELVHEFFVRKSLNYSGMISFLTYNEDNNKVYYVQDFAPWSDVEVKPIFNYNLTTKKIEGLSIGKYENTSPGHTSAILPIYLSPNERKFAYENRITEYKPILKVEGLGINLYYEIGNKDLGLDENAFIDFSCIQWSEDNNYLIFFAEDKIANKDLGYFMYNLSNRFIYPLKDGFCTR